MSCFSRRNRRHSHVAPAEFRSAGSSRTSSHETCQYSTSAAVVRWNQSSSDEDESTLRRSRPDPGGQCHRDRCEAAGDRKVADQSFRHPLEEATHVSAWQSDDEDSDRLITPSNDGCSLQNLSSLVNEPFSQRSSDDDVSINLINGNDNDDDLMSFQAVSY
jgi:hypothetical protein